jgi:hypothetical protein
MGVDDKWKVDYDSQGVGFMLRTHGRLLLPPYGWYDRRAQDEDEHELLRYAIETPRDLFGNILSIAKYRNRDKADLYVYYVNLARRIRRLSASDTQMAQRGEDYTWDDSFGFNQKLHPERWPYDFEIVDEGEFLVPTTRAGGMYFDSNARYAWKNLKFERRPIWVIEAKQLDPNYIYGKRIFYFDKETFLHARVENFDQRDRLFRSRDTLWVFLPEMGLFNQYYVAAHDHIRIHSSFGYTVSYQGAWLTRKDVSLPSWTGAK